MFPFDPPENIRKPKVLKGSKGLKAGTAPKSSTKYFDFIEKPDSSNGAETPSYIGTKPWNMVLDNKKFSSWIKKFKVKIKMWSQGTFPMFSALVHSNFMILTYVFLCLCMYIYIFLYVYMHIHRYMLCMYTFVNIYI